MSIIDEAFDIRIVKQLDNYIDYFYITWFSLGDHEAKVNIKETMDLDQITTIMAGICFLIIAQIHLYFNLLI